MKTFSQFYIESTALDRHLDRLKQEYKSGNLKQKYDAVQKMKEIERRMGVSSLVPPA
jgi:hypothetical protein